MGYSSQVFFGSDCAISALDLHHAKPQNTTLLLTLFPLERLSPLIVSDWPLLFVFMLRSSITSRDYH
jgi:hypothetical protein